MSHKSETIDNFAAVVLAGGKGSRLNCTELPKVMMSVGNRPIVSYTIDTLEKIGLPIFLVIGYKGETIVDYFKERVQYAKQEQQLGTAHAAYTGMKKLPEEIQDVLVLNGDDSLFYKKESLIDFIQQHKDGGSTVSVLTTGIEKGDKSYGRVIKRDGKIYLVEKENLQEKDLDNTQTSTGTFCINKKWFLENFTKMKRIEKLDEYGLPVAPELAQKQGLKVQTISLSNEKEWFGINTKENLEEANSRNKN